MAGIREELELDLRGALTSIGGLERSLNDATRSFALGIDDALTLLRGIQVTADVQPLAASIEEVAAEPLIVETEADTAPAIAEIEAIDPDDIQLDLFAQTDEAEAEIAAIDVEPLQLDLFADVDAVQEQLNEIKVEPVEIQVSATGAPQATEEIEELGAATVATSAGGSGLVTAIGGVSNLATISTGSVRNLVGSLGGLGRGAGVAGFGLAAVAGVANTLFTSAVEADAVMSRFTNTLGQFGPAVETINVANLNMGLEELATSLGSSDEKLRESITTLFQVAQASGFSGEAAAQYSEDITALAARAVALNPALGEVGDAARTLQTTLARGGRTITAYGLSITSLEITDRAIEQTGKLAGELTQTERSAAGASIALERVGGTLAEDIAKGSENPTIKLKALQEQFGNVLEELGRPLIAPVFELIEAVLPLGAALFQIFGDIAELILPVVIPAFDGLAKVFQALATELSPIVDEVGPAFAELGEALGAVLITLIPAVVILAEAFAGIVVALVPVITFAADAIKVFALVAEELRLLEIPAVLIAEYFDLVADAISRVTAIGADAVPLNEQIAESAEPLTANLLKAATSVEGFGTAADTTNGLLAVLTEEVTKATDSTSQFVLNNQIDDLERLGFTAETTAQSLQGGSAATDEFIATLIEQGEITSKTITVSGNLQQSLKENRAGTIALTRVSLDQLEGNTELIQSYVKEKIAVDDASGALLRKQVETGALSQEVFDYIVQQNTATSGYINYSDAVNVASEAERQFAVGLAAANVLLLEQLQADPTSLIEFTNAIANGTVAAQDFVVFGQQFGLTAEQVQAYAAGINQAINDFADTAASKFPTVQEVINDVDTAISPVAFLEAIRLREAGVVAFQENIKKIAAAGGVDLAKELALAGPEVAGAQAGVFAEANAATILEVERGVDDLTTTNNNARNAYVTTFGPTFAQDLAEVSRIASESFGSEFDIAGAITTETAVADKAAVDLGTAIQNTLDTEGEAAGSAFGLGLASGMEAATTAAEEAAKQLARNVASTMRYELQIRSPSRVGLSIGESLGEGFSLGLEESTRQVIATAEAITAAAAGALVSSDFGANSTVNAPAAFASAGSSTATTTITQNIEVNEVASDPIATAERTAFLLGQAARR